VLIKIIWSIN